MARVNEKRRQADVLKFYEDLVYQMKEDTYQLLLLHRAFLYQIQTVRCRLYDEADSQKRWWRFW